MIEARMTHARTTKELCRYIEGEIFVDPETKMKEERLVKRPLVGVLYLSKERLGGKPPKCITVTITGGKDATD